MKMKILMVSPECAPFSKVGGLADMVSSLSKE
ncbi:MAG: glycogen/starch synthase, partial [Opitutales bacterium]|nr:glycogen/starch synthase [Opitutales bacterium]